MGIIGFRRAEFECVECNQTPFPSRRRRERPVVRGATSDGVAREVLPVKASARLPARGGATRRQGSHMGSDAPLATATERTEPCLNSYTERGMAPHATRRLAATSNATATPRAARLSGAQPGGPRSSGLRTPRPPLFSTCVYNIVVETSRCPSSSCTVLMSDPLSSRCVAKECRNV